MIVRGADGVRVISEIATVSVTSDAVSGDAVFTDKFEDERYIRLVCESVFNRNFVQGRYI